MIPFGLIEFAERYQALEQQLFLSVIDRDIARGERDELKAWLRMYFIDGDAGALEFLKMAAELHEPRHGPRKVTA